MLQAVPSMLPVARGGRARTASAPARLRARLQTLPRLEPPGASPLSPRHQPRRTLKVLADLRDWIAHASSPPPHSASDSGQYSSLSQCLWSWRSHADVDAVKALLAAAEDANLAYRNGWTPLMVAMHVGAPAEVVQLLLDRGASPGVQAANGDSALHVAVMQPPVPRAPADTRALQLVLDAGADVNARNRLGFTPLMTASVFGAAPEVLALFLARGASVNAANERGFRALHYAALKPNFQLPDAAHAAANVRVLLDAGANANALSASRHSPLLCAVSRGEQAVAEVCALLLQAGASPNADLAVTPEMSLSVFQKAVELRAPAEVVRLMLDSGADVHFRDRAFGMTPLMLAAFLGVPAEGAAAMIVAAGAEIDAKAHNGATALHFAVRRDFELISARTVKLLLDNGANPAILSPMFGEYPVTISNNPQVVHLIEVRAWVVAGGASLA
jgi:ankyrin repeat protein